MSLPAVTILSLLLIVARSTGARPLSPNHRFTAYNPYWTQGPRYSLPLPPDQPDCIVNLCGERANPLALPLVSRADYKGDLPVARSTKRSNNVYRSGWTMSGMPFSVLYMNPKAQISERSPITGSLRSLPLIYEGSESLVKETPPVAEERVSNFPPEVQAQALTSHVDDQAAPTILPTRRQYSSIPQLFVSYGWGPISKKRDNIDE